MAIDIDFDSWLAFQARLRFKISFEEGIDDSLEDVARRFFGYIFKNIGKLLNNLSSIFLNSNLVCLSLTGSDRALREILYDAIQTTFTRSPEVVAAPEAEHSFVDEEVSDSQETSIEEKVSAGTPPVDGEEEDEDFQQEMTPPKSSRCSPWSDEEDEGPSKREKIRSKAGSQLYPIFGSGAKRRAVRSGKKRSSQEVVISETDRDSENEENLSPGKRPRRLYNVIERYSEFVYVCISFFMFFNHFRFEFLHYLI